MWQKNGLSKGTIPFIWQDSGSFEEKSECSGQMDLIKEKWVKMPSCKTLW